MKNEEKIKKLEEYIKKQKRGLDVLKSLDFEENDVVSVIHNDRENVGRIICIYGNNDGDFHANISIFSNGKTLYNISVLNIKKDVKAVEKQQRCCCCCRFCKWFN